nr:hypothetical protein [Trichoderma harzianum]
MAVARATSTKFQKGSLHTQATKTPYQKFSILVASGFRGPTGEGKRLGGGAGNKYRYGALGGLRYAAPGTVVTEDTLGERDSSGLGALTTRNRQAKKACKGT